jgi:hypothetical protein
MHSYSHALDLNLPRASPEQKLLHALSIYKIGTIDKMQKKGLEMLGLKREK